MTFDEAIQQLQELGAEQNRRVYRRHGVEKNMFGVVDVDHGETNCETPEAAAYTRKTWDRKGRQRVVAARL